VLDARFHGPTPAYTMVNTNVGSKFGHGRYELNCKIVNLLNQSIQQHIFGDVLKRQVVFELHVNLPK
jgi:hypothetical protein